jgi:hypothetical protein
MAVNTDKDTKSGACQTFDTADKDQIIAELKNRIAVLEGELQKKADAASSAFLGQKQAEEALLASEAKFRSLGEMAPETR